MRFLGCAALTVLVLAGCGQKMVSYESRTLQPVEGQVIWKKKPLVGGVVTFHPVNWKLDPGTTAPSGETGPDGRFKLGTYKKKPPQQNSWVNSGSGSLRSV
jgi:hypothetical protein